jgi:methionyl-tRNA formyltransferase
MAERIDAGEILYQVRVRTRLDDTVASLYERIMARSVGLMPRLVGDALRGRLSGRGQDELSASCYSSTSPEDFRLSFSLPAEVFVHRAAATPGRCWFALRDDKVHVVEAALDARGFRGRIEQVRGTAPAPGELLRLGRSQALVGGRPGQVRLRRLAAEGGPARPAAGFLREAGFEPGDRLEA